VQFISHDKATLLASGDFVVTEEVESVQTSDANPYQPITRTLTSRKAEQIGEWWTPRGNLEFITGTVVWNPGKLKHEVKVGDEVVYESKDKDECQRIASGEEPIPSES